MERDHVAEHATARPLAWLDDDFADPDHGWAHARTTNGIPTLLVQPDPRTGIQAGHIDVIRRWALTLELHD